MTLFWLASAVVATFCAAIVAGFENGVYALSHIRLRYRLSIQDPRAIVLQKLLDEPQRLISGILLTQNTAVYFSTAIVTSLLQGLGVKRAPVVSTLLLAVVFFIVVEAVPKTVFRRAADTLVYVLARPVTLVLTVFRPGEVALRAVTGIVKRLAKGADGIFDPSFTRERLAFYLREGHSEGILSEYQVKLTNNILRGQKATVGRAMVALESVPAVSSDATLEEFAETARRNRFSRYPVYEGAKDNIIGVVNIYDSLVDAKNSGSIRGVIRHPVHFAADVHVTEAIRVMSEERQPMAVVTDGRRAIGIVTLKDCLEEIVGELYAW